ncbi:MAG: DUF2652 domain-containing protein [Sphingobacteriales bacterium]
MPATTATILIPDISGFTNFVSTMELEHGSHLISSFLETIVQNADESFEVSEIEGDAVLLYKKGGVASRQEILDQCLKIFKAFHFQRKMIQQVVLCPCGACQGLIDLSLKFITHQGTISEIKVNRFTKAAGLDMIIAHRLLKNSITSHEYVLMTENFLQQVNDVNDSTGLEWKTSTDEFESIGKVNYQYALLKEIKDRVPDPPRPVVTEYIDESSSVILKIAAPFKDVYMAIIDIPNRIHWMNGLKKVEQDVDRVFIGSVHHCFFDNLEDVVSPVAIKLGDKEIIYAELHEVEQVNASAVFEFRFRDEGDGCEMACGIKSVKERPLTKELHYFLFEDMKLSLDKFKAYCENGFKP